MHSPGVSGAVVGDQGHGIGCGSGGNNGGNGVHERDLGWTEKAQMEFQWGFERLVVLDYLIRNTDRGMDNWMIKHHQDVQTEPPPSNTEKPISDGGENMASPGVSGGYVDNSAGEIEIGGAIAILFSAPS